MNYKNTVRILSAMAVLLSTVSSARDFFTNAKNSSQFDSLLRNSEFSVVLLYNDGKTSRDLLRTFKDVSKVGDYRDAQVQFIMVNTQKRDLSAISQRYGIAYAPAIFLFRGNSPVQLIKKEGEKMVPTGIAVLKDNFTVYGIQTMIDRLLPEVRKKAAAIRKARIERARANAYYAPYVGFGFGYPYWGWGYPYAGFGWGYGPGYWGGWW